MNKYNFSNRNNWDALSKLIILTVTVLQLTRWLILPQFMDIYYHLHSAWGFNQAGGYSSWDFWQYAPFGRVNIYPPFFQILLASLMKIGFGPVILAKLFETFAPILFMIVLWRFMRANFSQALAFFTLVAFGSAAAFYFSLINHLPSTLAFIFGLLALDQLFKKRIYFSLILLTLCFYTHIGVSWFFGLSLSIYLLGNQAYRKPGLRVLIGALILSLPVLVQQLSALGLISVIGLNLSERYQSQIKLLDYGLAAGGLYLAILARGKYYLLISFFAASLIFLAYPFRFFCGEGYFPVILLSAVFLLNLWESGLAKIIFKVTLISSVLFLLFISPTLSLSKLPPAQKITYGLKFPDSVFTNLLLAQGTTIWFPRDYLEIADLIKANSTSGDIIYSNLNILGPILGSISGRASANALLPEIKSSRIFDPLASSGIIVLTRDFENTGLVKAYNLEKVGQTRIVQVYKNPLALSGIKIQKASLPFWLIYLVFGAGVGVAWLNTVKKKC
jgi:hypothetical protein